MEQIPNIHSERIINGLQLEELWYDYVTSKSPQSTPRVLDFVNTYPLVAHIYNQLEVDQGRVLDPQEPPVRAEIVAFLEQHGEAIPAALEEELARAFEQAHQYHNERLIRQEDQLVREALSGSREDE